MQSKRVLTALITILGFNCIIFVVLMAARFVAEPHLVQDGSMQPTLIEGDGIIIEKTSKWRGQMIERGALVSYHPPNEASNGEALSDASHVLGRLTGLSIFPVEKFYIKRVIGISGDRLRIEPGVGVFVNGKLLDEPYVSEIAKYPVARQDLNLEFDVPKNKVFLLGDNRNSSDDSHKWGCLDQSEVIGRAWFMYSPLIKHMHKTNWIRPASLHGSSPYTNQ